MDVIYINVNVIKIKLLNLYKAYAKFNKDGHLEEVNNEHSFKVDDGQIKKILIQNEVKIFIKEHEDIYNIKIKDIFDSSVKKIF